VLLGDLLDFNALEAGQVEIVRTPFTPAGVVRRALHGFQAAADAKGLTLAAQLPREAEAEVLGDPARLGQVLEQLLSNAVKFTPSGGATVHVEAGDNDTWRFSVADTGVGIDPSQAERLFASFEMGDASATREHGGAGLGLAICRRLASLMGGRIEADGSPGGGATFTLVLPLTKPQARSLADRPLKVLVADDNPTNRRVVELILEAVGADVESVENGALAVAAAQADGFDLILMDLQMPVMDGLTAIAEIRKAESAAGRSRHPIVVLSANSAPTDVEASHLAGADAHLGKPIRPEVLLNALAEATAEKA
jgi:CheY-like chemotaxis protein